MLSRKFITSSRVITSNFIFSNFITSNLHNNNTFIKNFHNNNNNLVLHKPKINNIKLFSINNILNTSPKNNFSSLSAKLPKARSTKNKSNTSSTSQNSSSSPKVTRFNEVDDSYIYYVCKCIFWALLIGAIVEAPGLFFFAIVLFLLW